MTPDTQLLQGPSLQESTAAGGPEADALFREARRRRRNRRLFAAGTVIVIAITSVAIYGLVLRNRAPANGPNATTSGQGRPPWVARGIPGLSSGAAALAVDPTRPGVWFLTQDRTVEFWDAANHSLRTFPLPSSPTHNLNYGTQAGLVVSPTGTVWVGLGTTLAAINESTGDVTYFAPPQPGPIDPLAAINRSLWAHRGNWQLPMRTALT